MTRYPAVRGFVYVEHAQVFVIAYPGSEPEFSRSVPQGISDADYAASIALAYTEERDDEFLALVYPTDPAVHAASLLDVGALVDASNEAIRLGQAWDGEPTDDPYLAVQGAEFRQFLDNQG